MGRGKLGDVPQLRQYAFHKGKLFLKEDEAVRTVPMVHEVPGGIRTINSLGNYAEEREGAEKYGQVGLRDVQNGRNSVKVQGPDDPTGARSG